MKLPFDKNWGAVNETSVRFYAASRAMGEGIEVTKITAEVELTAGELEAAEVCPTEAIIQAWRRLRRALQRA